MFKWPIRRKLHKQVRKAVAVSIGFALVPELQVAEENLQNLPEATWTILSKKYFNEMAHDPIIIKALKKLIKTRSKGMFADLIDTLRQLGVEELSDLKKPEGESNVSSVSHMPEIPDDPLYLHPSQ